MSMNPEDLWTMSTDEVFAYIDEHPEIRERADHLRQGLAIAGLAEMWRDPIWEIASKRGWTYEHAKQQFARYSAEFRKLLGDA